MPVKENLCAKARMNGMMTLNVSLPNHTILDMTVDKCTPMMDLLVQITTANKLSPTNYVIEAVSKGRILPYKPSTPIGILETQTIRIASKKIAPKQLPANKSTPVVQSNLLPPFEQTVRLQIQLPRHQLYVRRVSYQTCLQNILTMVCDEKNLNPDKFDLKNSDNLCEIMDLSKTISDYNIHRLVLCPKKELNLMGLSRSIGLKREACNIVPHHSVCKSLHNLIDCSQDGNVSYEKPELLLYKKKSASLPNAYCISKPVSTRRPAPKPPVTTVIRHPTRTQNECTSNEFIHPWNNSNTRQSSAFSACSYVAESGRSYCYSLDEVGTSSSSHASSRTKPSGHKTINNLSKSLSNLTVTTDDRSPANAPLPLSNASKLRPKSASSLSLCAAGRRKKLPAPQPPLHSTKSLTCLQEEENIEVDFRSHLEQPVKSDAGSHSSTTSIADTVYGERNKFNNLKSCELSNDDIAADFDWRESPLPNSFYSSQNDDIVPNKPNNVTEIQHQCDCESSTKKIEPEVIKDGKRDSEALVMQHLGHDKSVQTNFLPTASGADSGVGSDDSIHSVFEGNLNPSKKFLAAPVNEHIMNNRHSRLENFSIRPYESSSRETMSRKRSSPLNCNSATQDVSNITRCEKTWTVQRSSSSVTHQSHFPPRYLSDKKCDQSSKLNNFSDKSKFQSSNPSSNTLSSSVLAVNRKMSGDQSQSNENENSSSLGRDFRSISTSGMEYHASALSFDQSSMHVSSVSSKLCSSEINPKLQSIQVANAILSKMNSSYLGQSSHTNVVNSFQIDVTSKDSLHDSEYSDVLIGQMNREDVPLETAVNSDESNVALLHKSDAFCASAASPQPVSSENSNQSGDMLKSISGDTDNTSIPLQNVSCLGNVATGSTDRHQTKRTYYTFSAYKKKLLGNDSQVPPMTKPDTGQRQRKETISPNHLEDDLNDGSVDTAENSSLSPKQNHEVERTAWLTNMWAAESGESNTHSTLLYSIRNFDRDVLKKNNLLY